MVIAIGSAEPFGKLTGLPTIKPVVGLQRVSVSTPAPALRSTTHTLPSVPSAMRIVLVAANDAGSGVAPPSAAPVGLNRSTKPAREIQSWVPTPSIESAVALSAPARVVTVPPGLAVLTVVPSIQTRSPLNSVLVFTTPAAMGLADAWPATSNAVNPAPVLLTRTWFCHEIASLLSTANASGANAVTVPVVSAALACVEPPTLAPTMAAIVTAAIAVERAFF